jgi:hypothetical protein
MAGAPKGNRNAEKYTEDQAIGLFEKALEDAQNNDECLSIQDACINSGIANSTFYDLLDKFIVLESYKRDINAAIIARINRNALKNKFNATASIWRFKQLGEEDRQKVDNTHELNINTSEKSKKKIDELGND